MSLILEIHDLVGRSHMYDAIIEDSVDTRQVPYLVRIAIGSAVTDVDASILVLAYQLPGDSIGLTEGCAGPEVQKDAVEA